MLLILHVVNDEFVFFSNFAQLKYSSTLTTGLHFLSIALMPGEGNMANEEITGCYYIGDQHHWETNSVKEKNSD